MTTNYGTYSYRHDLNCYVNIYYINNVSETVDVSLLNALIYDIHDNFKKYNDKIFDKSTINIWNPNRSDIPKAIQMCDGNSCWSVQSIGNYAGLTWWRDKRVDINGFFTKTSQDLAQVLSHEIGHLIDGITDLEKNNDDIIYPEWIRVRANHSTASTSPKELMAEDIRLLLGSRLAKGYERGDYIQANKVQGLHDMLLIWHPVWLYTNEKKQQGSRIFQSNVSYKYSKTDFNYFAVQFCVETTINNNTVINRQWVWIDKVAIWNWVYLDNKWQWKPVKTF